MSKCPFHKATSFFKRKESNTLSETQVQKDHYSKGKPVEFSGFEMNTFNELEIKGLESLKPFVLKNSDKIVERFYNNIQKQPELVKIITDHSTIERLKVTFQAYVNEMFDGDFGKSFIQRRSAIASRHVKIGLKHHWYIWSYQELCNALMDMLSELTTDPKELIEMSKLIMKLMNLEQQLVIDAYDKEQTRLRKLEEEKKKQIQEKLNESSINLTNVVFETDSSLQKMSEKLKGILDKSIKVTELSNRVEDKSKNGMEQIEQQNKQTEEIQKNTSLIREEVNGLSNVVHEIEKVALLVREIASQTGLLALNAAIEAAHAGEHGRGFQVVANEVKKLSEQTTQSVASVANLVHKIEEQLNNVVTSAEKTEIMVVESKRTMDDITNYFHEILFSIENNKDQTKKIETEIEHFSSTLSEIAQASANISATATNIQDTFELLD